MGEPGLYAPGRDLGRLPLHRAALTGLQHGVTTMDTLASLGITASLLWSVQAMLFGGAGMAGMKMPFAVTFGPVSQAPCTLTWPPG